MKKKNVCMMFAAAGICAACALLLVGSMGIYAEKTGKEQLIPISSDSETAQMLSDVLEESMERKTPVASGPLSDGELKNIWDRMYAEYESSDQGREELKQEETEAALHEKLVKEGYGDVYGLSLDSAKLGVSAAGLLFLKEINRLFPKEQFESFYIRSARLESEIGVNGLSYIAWTGSIVNMENAADPSYRSYDFEIDAISGKINSFGKFRPYQANQDYSKISWTDEEILEQAKELAANYGLASGEELDWQNVELLNGTNEAGSLMDELKQDPESSISLSNVVKFQKNGKMNFYLGMDFETGELCNYFWPGTSHGY